MSATTESQLTVPQQLVHVNRRARVIAILLVTVAASLLVLAVLALNGDFSAGSDEPPAAVSAAGAVNLAPGVRYDGGPDEGTRGASPPAVVTTADALDRNLVESSSRYDGGPDEGTRGPGR